MLRRAEARPNNAASEVYASAKILDDALFGLADYTASDARRSGAGSFTCHCVNHDGGAAIAENGMLVSAHGDIGRHDHRVAGSVGADDERKGRNVSGWAPRGVRMSGSAGKVRASRLEVRGLALGVLMDVQGVFTRRQALHVQFDFYSMRSFAEHGGAHVLTLSVFDFHRN